MVRRLILGPIKGLLIGGALALILVKGLGVMTFGAAVAYSCAALTGVLAGLLAGKPVWAKDARVEAGLKAVVGAGLAAGLMFALRRWAGIPLDVSGFGGGAGALGELPLVSLPLIAITLALLFDLDNTRDEAASTEAGGTPVPKQRVLSDQASGEFDELEDREQRVDHSRRQRPR
jgi:hypothetical protein